MTHTETVQQIYAAFGRGDVPAISERLAEDVTWEYAQVSTDVPWLQPRRGRAEVPAFFEQLGGVEFQQFQPKTILENGDVVVVLLDVAFDVKATGKWVVEEDEVHLWYFNSEGLVTRFRHRVDTHQHWKATRSAESPVLH